MPVKLPDWNTWSQYRREHLGISDAESRGYRLQKWIEIVKKQKSLTRQAGCGTIDATQARTNRAKGCSRPKR